MDAQENTTISLKDAIGTGIVIDIILLVVSSLVLDTGGVFRVVFCVVLGHWAGNAFIIFRRKLRMTKMDKDFIRFGSLALVVVAFVIGFLCDIFGK